MDSLLKMNTQTNLYFGFRMPNGDDVADLAWRFFLSDVVSPLFPDGFNVTEGRGQWRTAGGEIISEPSRVLTIVWHDERKSGAVDPFSGPSERIETVRNAYKGRFRQESVLRVDSEVVAWF